MLFSFSFSSHFKLGTVQRRDLLFPLPGNFSQLINRLPPLLPSFHPPISRMNAMNSKGWRNLKNLLIGITTTPTAIKKSVMTTSSSTRLEPSATPTASTTKKEAVSTATTISATATNNLPPSTPDEYEQAREKFLAQDRGVAFDTQAIARATRLERSADREVKRVRQHERADFGASSPHGSEHFLGNLEGINRSQLMKISRRMPKGAHLHCHFNTCLHPSFLIRQARGMKSMFVRSSVALVGPEDFARAAISFAVLPPDTLGSDIFDPGYSPLGWARYPDFLERFPSAMLGGEDPESWLANKMVIREQEAHDIHQTADGYVYYRARL